jgi:cytochrome c556
MMRRAILATALALLVGVGPMSAGQAHQNHRHGANAAKFGLKFRFSTMQALSIHMALLAAEARGEIKLTDARRRAHGGAVEALSLLIVDLFQDETWQRTRAKQEIWIDWEGFAAAARALEKASATLAAATSGDDPATVKAAIEATGKSCSSCHKAFRKPKRRQ